MQMYDSDEVLKFLMHFIGRPTALGVPRSITQSNQQF